MVLDRDSREAKGPRQADGYRLGLLLFAALCLVLFVVVAYAGRAGGAPTIPAGDVALIEDMPGGGGDVTQARFQRVLDRIAGQHGEAGAPRPGGPGYEEFKEKALNELFGNVQTEALAAELGIVVGSADVAARRKFVRETAFGSDAAFRRFAEEMRHAGADINEEFRLEILGGRIRDRLWREAPSPSRSDIEEYFEHRGSPAPIGGESLSAQKGRLRSKLTRVVALQHVIDFTAEFDLLLKSRTFCAPGYVTGFCANAKPFEHPAAAPPRCYEKEASYAGLLGSCPAPVVQLVPAMPGSVTSLKPWGDRLAQRPQPAAAGP